MLDGKDLNVLISDIIEENNYKHCRLCLNSILDGFVKFDDNLPIKIGETYPTMSEILKRFLGDQVWHDVPGIDAICKKCLNQIVEAVKFIKKCEDSTNLLTNIFNNIEKTLNCHIELTPQEDNLYIIVNEQGSQALIMKSKELCKKSNIKLLKCNDSEEISTSGKNLKINSPSHEQLICEKCKDICLDIDELNDHKVSTATYTCMNCNIYRCTEYSLKKHEHNQMMFFCKACDKSFNSLEKLQQHELKHGSRFICPKCSKTYTTKEFYLRHVKLCKEDLIDPHPMRNEIQKSYFCNKCSKGYSTPGGLRVHERFVHGNAKTHNCPHCNKQFTAPSYLKVHMVTHTGERNFKCEMCTKRFVSKEALLYHTRRHTGEKPYSCNQCDERFVNASARAEHIKFKHIGPTLKCEICSRKFVTKIFLRQHMNRHHDPMNKLYVGRSIAPPNEPVEQNVRYFVKGNI